ncbi:MAG TPA: hypothetical protein VN807_06450 [Candidatus Sulfotelmatobacter sp.]|nr:hypothetical protein [Candidatus Sulfotelmatobacter sp.]
MALYLKPHSPEWFAALEAFEPAQALATRRILEFAGQADVCSVCGDDPARDYKLVGASFPENAVATIRLCDDCLNIRTGTMSERYEPFVG